MHRLRQCRDMVSTVTTVYLPSSHAVFSFPIRTRNRKYCIYCRENWITVAMDTNQHTLYFPISSTYKYLLWLYMHHPFTLVHMRARVNNYFKCIYSKIVFVFLEFPRSSHTSTVHMKSGLPRGPFWLVDRSSQLRIYYYEWGSLRKLLHCLQKWKVPPAYQLARRDRRDRQNLFNNYPQG